MKRLLCTISICAMLLLLNSCRTDSEPKRLELQLSVNAIHVVHGSGDAIDILDEETINKLEEILNSVELVALEEPIDKDGYTYAIYIESNHENMSILASDMVWIGEVEYEFDDSKLYDELFAITDSYYLKSVENGK